MEIIVKSLLGVILLVGLLPSLAVAQSYNYSIGYGYGRPGGPSGQGSDPVPVADTEDVGTWDQFMIDTAAPTYQNYNGLNLVAGGRSGIAAISSLPNAWFPNSSPTQAIVIENHPSLTSLEALASITSIGQNIYLSGLGITSLNGLRNLTSTIQVTATDSASLVDISALGSLTSTVRVDLDYDIQNRNGFVPIPEGSWLCESAQSGLFYMEIQANVCAAVSN
jgi:hypothetical protein